VSPASEGLDIMSLLITPVQRVPRYLLLLRELLRFTPAEHAHRSSLERAIKKIGAIATHINEMQRAFENGSTLLEMQHQITGMTDELNLFQPHRRLCRHGILTLVKQEGTGGIALTAELLGQPAMVILFNDLIRQSRRREAHQ
jgi:hypothetical protein